jgi:signal transduction histidine kinase
VSLRFEQQVDEARLSIVDNGRGFDPASSSLEGMGMTSMRERAAAVQAQFKLSSQVGAGTQLLLSWHPKVNDEEGAGQ